MDVVAALAHAIRNAPARSDRAIAEAVLARLAAPDVRNEIHEAVHDAFVSARAAYVARDDLYENPSNSRVAAEIASAAMVGRLTGHLGAPRAVTDLDLAEAVATTVHYKGWRFRAVPLADGGIGVEVEATAPDTHRPERPFTTTRVVGVTSTVEEACFRAAMLVELHEAQERFRVGGKAVFDPHSTATMAAPTNVRA
ncbi:MAG TPA: hypothetical protein VF230_01630 [Acidimicrobiales bacterium]